MTTDPLATQDPVWGAPDPSPRRWGIRETAVAVGVAAVIAGLGGAAIYAATDGNSHSMGGAHQPFGGGPGGPGGQRFGPGGPMNGPGPFGPPPLHGEFVVPDGSGGYTTELSQTGTVTAISPTSITVRSEDGFSQTYVIPQTTQPPFAVDEQVSVHATRTGQTVTATSIGKPEDVGPGGPVGPPHR
ncbi:hypothetical protein [Mycobacterium sp. MMS18-G62]